MLEAIPRCCAALCGVGFLAWLGMAGWGVAGEVESAAGLLHNGIQAYQKGEWLQAEERLGRFASDYGRSAEAAPYMEKVLRLLALSRVQQAKWTEALPPMERVLAGYPAGEGTEELRFWLGVARLRSGDTGGARLALADFLKSHPASPRVAEAQLLMAMAFFAEKNFAATADALGTITGELSPSMAAQVGLLRLAALVESGKASEALAVLRTFDPHSESASRLSAYQLLALSLGDQLAGKGETRRALEAYQRVWPKGRVLARQEGRLKELEAEWVRVSADKAGDRFAEMRLRGLLDQVRADVANVEKIPDYDTALQFRIARCYTDLERFREAQLVLARMAEKLPASEMMAQAQYARLVCLARLERWEEATALAGEFERQFPGHALVPNAAYFRAEALMRSQAHAMAAEAFAGVAGRFPEFPEAERCHFLSGYCQMMLDRNGEAVAHFDRHLERWQRGGFREQVVYWRAMALHYAKEYEQSREAHGQYLKEFPKGTHAADSELRRAYALFAGKDYVGAYKELEAVIQKHPGTVTADEAANLLGDSYFALGETDRGMEAYRRTSRRDGRMFDYAWFRIGQAYKALEQFDRQEAHFREFLRVRPDSPRLAEALGQLAANHRRNGDEEKACGIYWEAFREHGDNVEMQGVEDLVLTLVRMNRGPERLETFLSRLVELEKESLGSGRKTLAARAVWARAQALAKTRPDLAQQALCPLAGEKEEELLHLSARLLADVGDALRGAGQPEKARLCYHAIRRWHPRSLLKDRAYAGLGLLAEAEGKHREALEWFGFFEKESVQSPLLGAVLQARARILMAGGKNDEAIAVLGRVLEVPSARGRGWVEALYRMGELYLQQGEPGKAVPHFQRIYVMYGRWTDYVAKSYWQSGQAFEKMQRPDEARKTYEELVSHTHLKDTPEYARARVRLGELGL